MKKLLICVNVDWFFLSHRLAIAQKASCNGFEVHVATCITSRKEELESYGFIVHNIPVVRGKSSLLLEIKSFISFVRLFSRIKPDLVHLITIKPVLYGGIAARLTSVKNVVVAISGLGHVFISSGFLAKFRVFFIGLIYRYALNHINLAVIFQNKDDQVLIAKLAHLRDESIYLIPGSGIDLESYKYTAENTAQTIVIMVSRLLTEKGVVEYVEAASSLKRIYPNVKFQLVGSVDEGNPASIPDDLINKWAQQGYVEILGHSDDVALLLSRAHIVVLPSYREGFPKVLIEAAACGKPIITTDVPGCRDAIIPDVTGVLVPVRNVKDLIIQIERFILDKKLRIQMGKEGRLLAEKKYSIEQVVDTHLIIYRKVLGYS